MGANHSQTARLVAAKFCMRTGKTATNRNMHKNIDFSTPFVCKLGVV